MKTIQRFFISLLAAAVIGGSRWLYETSLIRSVIDAQGGIAMAFSFIICAATALIVFILFFTTLNFFAKDNGTLGTVFLLGLILVAGLTGRSMIRIYRTKAALTDAANEYTSPDRLRSLVGYKTGFGYEIDNRIASNPNTPVDVLRTLHGIPGHIGTEMSLASNPNTPDNILIELSKIDKESMQRILARNPNTPDDILIKLSQSNNKSVRKSLTKNPRYEQVIGQTKTSTTDGKQKKK